MKFKSLIIISIACCINFMGAAQSNDLLFTQLPSDLGLNNTSITSIAQDSRGQLWFATWVGLYRYDGYNAKLYKVNISNEYSLTSNKITKIYSASNGDLYISSLRGGVVKYRFEYDDFIAIPMDDKNPNSVRNNVWDIFEDKNQNIWAATEKGIAILYKGGKQFENTDAFLKSKINSKRTLQITNAESEYIWVSSEDGVYVYYVGKKNEISEMFHYTFQFNSYTSEQSNFISQVIKLKDENFLILGKSGLVEMNIKSGFEKASHQLIESTGNNFEFPRTILAGAVTQAAYTIGTNDGLRFLGHDKKLKPSIFLKGKVVRSLFKDSFGTTWVGTENGLFKVTANLPLSKKYTFEENKDYAYNTIENLALGSSGIWMAWQNGLLSRMKNEDLASETRHMENFQVRKNERQSLKDRISQIVYDGKNSLYIATQGSGILKVNETNNSSGHLDVVESIDHTKGLVDNYIMSLAYNNENLWFGTWNNGLFQYNTVKKKVGSPLLNAQIVKELKEVPIIKLIFIDQHTLLVATRGFGIYIFKLNTDNSLTLKHHLHRNNKIKISNDFITDVQVYNSQIWISSEAGIDVFDYQKNQILTNNINDLIPKSIVQAIAILSDTSFWLSTYNDGLIEFIKRDNVYFSKKHFKSSLSNYASNAAIKIKSDICLFGGSQGFSMINTNNKVYLSSPPIPYITDVKIENETIDYQKKINGSIKIDKVINELPQVKLNHKDNSISIHISALHSAETQDVTYAYMLDGFHKDWIITNENDKTLHFTNLSPKNYKFRFKAANSDGVWSEVKELKIKMSPPWWFSTLAIIVYSILFIAAIYGIVKLFLAKAKYDHEIHLEKMERAKIEELNQMKMKFYTTISHELRTPLTMIISPMEQLINQKEKSDPQKSYQLILRNAKKLHSMINQLLDFRKHESGSTTLFLKKMDLVEFSNEVLLGFQNLAERKNIQLVFESFVPKMYLCFDEEQIEKLYNNLISNSLKYTKNNGKIILKIAEADKANFIKISIEDNGIGIDSKDVVHIFNRFYQGRNHVNSGYGLGLSIVKSIVELHHGEITVQSAKNEGTVITIILPTNLQSTDHSEEPNKFINERVDVFIDEDEMENLSEIESAIELRKKILIVEDNEEIKEYLKENFIGEFDVSMASNGLNGLSLAVEEIPDVIISDIAMDEMDGLTMCREIKRNMATSHIPIILLTARTAIDSKIQGYDFGANAYVTKPFNMELLKKQVNNLLNYREVLKSKFLQHVPNTDENKTTRRFEPSMPAEEALDEKFMDVFIKRIESKLANSELTVDDLAKDMLMSRIQIYRKVKALTGQTPNVFIRSLRLKRAAQYLSLGELSISEITYRVGFNDLKYFREKFKEEYGVNPSEYKSSLKKV